MTYIRKAIDTLEALNKILDDKESPVQRRGENGVQYAIDLLKAMERAAGFQVGNRVQLAKTIDTSNAPGWKWYAKTLVKGAGATIKSVDYWASEEVYRYGVRFDKVVGPEGQERAKQSTFELYEHNLERGGEGETTMPQFTIKANLNTYMTYEVIADNREEAENLLNDALLGDEEAKNAIVSQEKEDDDFAFFDAED